MSSASGPKSPAPESQDPESSADSAGVTRRLAEFAAAPAGAFPETVRHEAHRAFLNWVGCAIGGARHETIDIAIAALAPVSGKPEASVLGRGERLDPLHAALMNGISSHVLDFDDTHPGTAIHPTSPVASALLAFAEHRRVSGADLIDALVLGIEVECRIGGAVLPEHSAIGWHITGTAGVFGAAAAIGRVLRLDARRMAWALGLAATQPVGLREMFGSMTKSFHPGRAAQNGMTAALLAERGYTSSTEAIEAKRGWGNVLGTNPHYGAVIEGLGERWEILGNTYKPFACGLVVHPTIDGCLQLRHEGLDPAQIERVALAVHPWVIELTSKRTPQTGLEGKFSVYHAAAVALIEGDGGERQFSDRAVRDPAIVALRERVDATIAPGMALDAARVEVSLRDGTTLVRDVPHSIGSLARPMTDAALEAKFHGLADDVIGAGRSDALIRLCWSLADLADAAEIARAARPA